MRPPNGTMIYWRQKGTLTWRFGYTSYVSNGNLVRMGTYNGDDMGGYIVDPSDIEWKPY